MQIVECPTAQKIDPRVRRTRKLLEDALRSLLTERSYNQISVADIAERATVNRATFYAHFEDKEHLATATLRDDLRAGLFAKLTPGTQLTSESLTEVGAALYEFMGDAIRGCRKHAGEFAMTFSVTLQQTIHEVMSFWIEHDAGSMKWFPGATSETAATVLASSLFGGAVRWSATVPRPSAREAAGQVVALLLR